MRRIGTIRLFVVTAACVMFVRTAAAQELPGLGMGNVAGTGSVTIEHAPDVLRMQVDISAEGKDIKEAISKLKEAENQARQKLTKLGAAESAITFGDPQAQNGSRRQQMERMIQMRTGRRPKAPKNQAPSVTVSATLKAEWPLKGKTGDELLLESQDLQAKVKAADVSGGAKDANAAGEDQEAAEEAQMSFGPDGQGNPHDPVFLFVSKISDDEREKARAEAFKKAKDDATRLAKAAGATLGALRFLSSNAGPNIGDRYNETYNELPPQYQRVFYGLMNRGQGQGEEPAEAVGVQPGKVAYRVMVSASFALSG